MLWGKVIDHTRCIGCHACSVACKQENDVPLGVFRTWVKNVEKGTFPDTRRHFAVLRCNQCDDAPCVAICPVTAMFRRRDGIVDFDPELCIGCKACIQACPYDAIHIDPTSGTAAKCHFCAHRVEVGLEPACVTACPERALLVGDLDDPTSEVARIVAREPVTVRKPELGTHPKVFYLGVDQSAIDPLAADRPPDSMWGRGRVLPVFEGEGAAPVKEERAAGRVAAARVAYDVPREGHPWGWKISAYLFSKSLGAGALAVGGPALLLTAGLEGGWLDRRLLAPPLIALAALAATTLFLVLDLKRPERFLRLITRPQWRSWLVRGTYCILASVALATAWLALSVLAAPAPPPPDPDAMPGLVRLADVPWSFRIVAALAGASAIPCAAYTAFLFAQARGRAFWQSPLLPLHLVAQAVLAGAAALGAIAAVAGGAVAARPYVVVLLGALGVDWLAILSELHLGAGPEDARLAARSITHGRFRDVYRTGVLLARVTAVLFAAAALHYGGFLGQASAVVAALAAFGGLATWEHLYVLAGQDPPLS